MSKQGGSQGDAKNRELQVIVLGVSDEDECALVQTTDGSDEQFVVRRADTGDAWPSLQVGAITWLVVTPGRLGRVLAVRAKPQSSP